MCEDSQRNPPRAGARGHRSPGETITDACCCHFRFRPPVGLSVDPPVGPLVDPPVDPPAPGCHECKPSSTTRTPCCCCCCCCSSSPSATATSSTLAALDAAALTRRGSGRRRPQPPPHVNTTMTSTTRGPERPGPGRPRRVRGAEGITTPAAGRRPSRPSRPSSCPRWAGRRTGRRTADPSR